MESVNYVTQWLISRPFPEGIITVRLHSTNSGLDIRDDVRSVSPGQVRTAVTEEGDRCWHVHSTIAHDTGETSQVWGPFSSDADAGLFARQLHQCIESPGVTCHGWSTHSSYPAPASQFDQATAAEPRGAL